MNILKIPQTNGLGKTKGVSAAPEKILLGLEEIYSNESFEEIFVDKLNISEVSLSGDLVKDNDLVYEKSFSLFSSGKTIFLGGDHSTSYPTTRAFFDFCENSGKEPCLIVFDAHPDLMEPVDQKIPTHEEWLNALLRDGFNPKNILLVGVRNSDPSESKIIREKGIKLISVDNLLLDLEGRTDSIMEFAHGKELYLSLDIDVVDPAFAPATGYCEPGGLTSRQFLYILKRMKKMKNLFATDLVEINPSKDESGKTIQLGSKILSELI